MLYWFRTPPDVRVGRRPLDPDSTDAIEQAFPDVRFDWPQLREAHAARVAGEERAADARPERRGAERRMVRRSPGPPAGRENGSAHRDSASAPGQRHDGHTDASQTNPSPGETT